MKRSSPRGPSVPAGYLSPAEIVVDGDIGDPRVEQAIGRLEQSLLDDPAFPVPPARLEVNDARDLALLTLPFPGKPASPEAAEDMAALREQHIPAAFAGTPAEVYVGGLTAEVADFYGIVDFYTPIRLHLRAGSQLHHPHDGLSARSWIPIKAIIMNLLSVGATYGLLVLVFQKGVATDLLGFQQAEVIDAWIPLFLFRHPLRALHGLSRFPAQPHP